MRCIRPNNGQIDFVFLHFDVSSCIICSGLGEVLTNICTSYPEINFLVLCGHTHDKAQYSPFPNLIVEAAGHAEYNAPEVQKIVLIE